MKLRSRRLLSFVSPACWLVVSLAFNTGATLCLSANETIPVQREEANLHSITFIDADRGWAVGQLGTILHTQDSGMTWKVQASGSSATLNCVAMYNSQRGLAVGGTTQPYTQSSVGEVMVTMDGGMSWRAVSGHDLPRLRHLIIGPQGKCIAVGDWSPVHLTSVFVSSDGGLQWQPQACELLGGAIGLAGSVNDYLVLSERGEVIRVRNDAAPQMILSANDDWRMLAGNETKRMLIGPRGAILSNDHGDSWKVVSQDDQVPLSIDGEQSATATWFKDELWFAQATSPVIATLNANLSSAVPDNVIVNPAEAPLRSIFRLDADRGWAVGDFGVVISTRDGGQTWRSVRGGGKSTAVMAIAANAESLPWSLMASESLQHQKRIALVIDREGPTINASERDRLADASALLGPSTTLANRANRSNAAQMLVTCKPAVLLLDQALPQPIRALWSAAAMEAGVKRVLEVGGRGSQTVHVAAAIPTAGILASDAWFDAIAKVNPSCLPPSRLMLATRYDMASDSLAGDGLASCTGNDPRYRWSRVHTASRRQMQVLQARTAEMTWIDSLIASSESVDGFRNQLTAVLPRMSESDRQRMFARLISMAARRGRPDLYLAAIETMMSTANMHGDLTDINATAHTQLSQELASVAGLRLAGIRASAEWQHTFGRSMLEAAPSIDALAQATAKQPIVDLAVHLSPFQISSAPQNTGPGPIGMATNNPLGRSEFSEAEAKSLGIQLVGGTSLSNTSPGESDKRAKPAMVDLRWEFHPAVLLVEQMIERAVDPNRPQRSETAPVATDASPEELQTDAPKLVPLNDVRSSAATNLKRIAQLRSAGTWGVLASDLRLPETLFAPTASAQPHLDGRFNEPWWRGGQSFESLNGAVHVQIAHDDQFVYVAVDAPTLAASSLTGKDRQRDTTLDSTDRYRLRFDIDRDLMTAFEFEFDGEGNTRDSCDGFLAYHPRWFIACTESEGRTRAEIAIQKSDLGAGNFLSGSLWNFSIDRQEGVPSDRGLSLPVASQWLPLMWE